MDRDSRSVSIVLQAEDGIRAWSVTGVQTCALPISIVTVPVATVCEALELLVKLAKAPSPTIVSASTRSNAESTSFWRVSSRRCESPDVDICEQDRHPGRATRPPEG